MIESIKNKKITTYDEFKKEFNKSIVKWLVILELSKDKKYGISDFE